VIATSPEQAGDTLERGMKGLDQGSGRAPRGQHQQAATLLALASEQMPEQVAGIVGIQRDAVARAAEQHADTWSRQFVELGTGLSSVGRAVTLHPVPRSERPDSVAAFEAAVAQGN